MPKRKGFSLTADAEVNAIATKVKNKSLFGKGKKSSKLNKYRKYREICSDTTQPLKKVDNNLIIISGIGGGELNLRVLIDPASQAEIISQEAVE